MLIAKFYPWSEPLSLRLRVMAVLWVGLALILAALPCQANQTAAVAAARTVISQQIDAFRRDDGPGAYTYASPNVKAIFPSPGIFMEMVRTGYPAVYRPRSYSFEVAKWQEDGRLMQPVRIEWQGGDPLIAVYLMARQADGAWKIDGVFMVRDDRVGA